MSSGGCFAPERISGPSTSPSGSSGRANLAQGTVCKILDQEEIKPHKVRYYLEQRDPDFADKMAQVLCVYRKVKILKQVASAAKNKPKEKVAVIRQVPICRPNRAGTRALRATTNTSATARSAYSPVSISSAARCTP